MPQRISIDIFKDRIAVSNSIVIVPHHNPDGDAIGSSLGLWHILTRMGKQVDVAVPNEFPSFLAWMPGSDAVTDFGKDPVKVKMLFDRCDLMIIVDFNANKRVRDMEPILSGCNAFKVMIDHHPYPEPDTAQLMISDTSVSSTCELAFNVIAQSGLLPYTDINAATCFYTGIITDTGVLSHNSSRPETYQTVAELMKYGINKDLVHQLLFHSNSYDRMRLLGYVLCEKMKLLPEFRAAYITLNAAELVRFNFQPGDTEGFVNYPLSIEGIDISGFFMERDGKVKVSLRSRGNYAVNKLSEINFNGGGHLNAAGGESDLPLNDALDKFIKALPMFFNS
ncbi:MAG: bifunctional oligoribonuclease/PAP phosphatase NrnA [Breznakibacter sp.]